jgi:hypothetical protein
MQDNERHCHCNKQCRRDDDASSDWTLAWPIQSPLPAVIPRISRVPRMAVSALNFRETSSVPSTELFVE